jgi:hypothetical protein
VMAGLSMLSASSSSDGNADADDGHQRFHSWMTMLYGQEYFHGKGFVREFCHISSFH